MMDREQATEMQAGQDQWCLVWGTPYGVADLGAIHTSQDNQGNVRAFVFDATPRKGATFRYCRTREEMYQWFEDFPYRVCAIPVSLARVLLPGKNFTVFSKPDLEPIEPSV